MKARDGMDATTDEVTFSLDFVIKASVSCQADPLQLQLTLAYHAAANCKLFLL